MSKKINVIAITALAILGTLIFFYKKSHDSTQSVQEKTSELNKETQSRHASEQGSFIKNGEHLPWGNMPFEVIKSKANAGDSNSQLLLSEIYETCFPYNLIGKNGLKGNNLIQWSEIGKNKNVESRMRKISKEYEDYCAAVDGGDVIPLDAINLWREQSAKGGNVVAKIISESRAVNSTASREEILSIVEEAIKSKKPEAFFSMGDFSSGAQQAVTGTEYSSLFDGQYAAFAWQVAACRAGFDCSSTSRVMINLCLYHAACEYSSFEDFAVNQIPPSERRQFNEQVRLIQTHL